MLAIVVDGGPILIQHWVKSSVLWACTALFEFAVAAAVAAVDAAIADVYCHHLITTASL